MKKKPRDWKNCPRCENKKFKTVNKKEKIFMCRGCGLELEDKTNAII